MHRPRLTSIALATLAAAACGAGGLNIWLYPAPHLAEAEEALVVAYESHGLRAIDGEDANSKCWRDMNRPEAYARKDIACRLHIQPGEHSVVVRTSPTGGQTVTLTFTALPGRIYGLDRSNCSTSSFSSEARQQSCQMEMREVGRLTEGG